MTKTKRARLRAQQKKANRAKIARRKLQQKLYRTIIEAHPNLISDSHVQGLIYDRGYMDVRPMRTVYGREIPTEGWAHKVPERDMSPIDPLAP